MSGGVALPHQSGTLHHCAQPVSTLSTYSQHTDTCAQDGATPLFMAAWKGHLEVVRELVEAGADKSVQTNRGDTALSVAQRMGYHDIADLLAVRSRGIPGGCGCAVS